jgi:hypothetical protein
MQPDEYRFGDVIHARMDVHGKLRPETWRDRWTEAIASVVGPRPIREVVSVDAEAGVITLARP